MKPLAAIALVLALAGCTATTTPDPTPTLDSATTPTVRCDLGDLESTGVWIPAAGQRFEAGLLGAGHTVAILVPQSESDYCGFAPYALELAAAGIQSLLINPCGAGATECGAGTNVVTSGSEAVIAAADYARTFGATRVVVVGASLGGTIAIAAGELCGLGCSFDAIADLSGPIEYEGVNTMTDASLLAVPLFLAVSNDDTVVTGAELETLVAASSSQQAGIYTGAGHGWSQLFDEDGSPSSVADQLTGFIAG